ncbi:MULTISPECIES: hypothetical protein [unclassified Streptomyces]|uniref:hypothetical protein n=1 Tax=unclassified Streptomyces TaxID=2593676 RepID=UPI0036FFBD5D
MTSHVDEQIAARIARVRQEKANRRQQRTELEEAREHGLEARYTAKLARWASEDK